MFIAYLKQAGEGCDYTIACGELLLKLEAQTLADAITELQRLCLGTSEELWDDVHYSQTLKSVILYEILNVEELPIKEWYAETQEAQQQYKCAEQIEIDRAKYERLKAQFEG